MLSRARLVFFASLVLAGLLLVLELPLGQLMGARSSAATTAAELAKVQAENKRLSNQVRDLQRGATIQQIAHEEYGLVEPGQRTVVVMPGSAIGTGTGHGTGHATGHGMTAARVRGGSSTPLGSHTIPQSDVVPSDALLAPPPGAKGAGQGQGFWQRVLNRLEFWKGSV